MSQELFIGALFSKYDGIDFFYTEIDVKKTLFEEDSPIKTRFIKTDGISAVFREVISEEP